MRLIIILFTLFYFNFSIAQDPFNPGNLGVENLSAWFKATDLEIEDDVTAWPTSYTNLSSTIILEDNEAPYPYASNQGFYSNYNNAVNFEGSTVEAMKVLEVHDLVDLLDNTSFGGTGTFLAAYYLPSNSCAGCHVVN